MRELTNEVTSCAVSTSSVSCVARIALNSAAATATASLTVAAA
jgi:hypothetical protein